MYGSYYSATSGMVSQVNRLDIIANNLANANTTAFKQDNVVFGDYMRLNKEVRDDLPKENHTRDGAQFLNRSLNRNPRIVEEYTNYNLGTLKTTGNDLDVALSQNDLFFAVETPNGIRFTRNGSFKLDDKGQITDALGNPILSSNYFDNGHKPITLPLNSSITIDQNGIISSNGTIINSIMVTQIQNPKNLQKEGNSNYLIPMAHTAIDNQGNLYKNGEKFDKLTKEQLLNVTSYSGIKDLSELPENLNLGIDKFGNILVNLEAVTTLNSEQEKVLKNIEIYTDSNAVKQRYLEGSNVNAVQQMTAMIETQRMLEMYQKVMTTQMNDMNQDAITKIAKTSR